MIGGFAPESTMHLLDHLEDASVRQDIIPFTDFLSLNLTIGLHRYVRLEALHQKIDSRDDLIALRLEAHNRST